jgi:hypothetical protein
MALLNEIVRAGTEQFEFFIDIQPFTIVQQTKNANFYTTALAPFDKENPLAFFFKKPKIWKESGK